MIRNHFGSSPEPVPCTFAAAVDDGERLAVLLPTPEEDGGFERHPFGLGAILTWARERPRAIEVVAPVDQAPALARHAEGFAHVSVSVIDQTALATAAPAPLPSVPLLSPAAEAHRGLFESVGAVPVDDFGHLVAEVVGLEIGRVDGVTGQLSVGVGTTDRELHAYVHVDIPAEQSLRRAAELVRSIRRSGAPGHPLNRRGRQRWLRAIAHAEPALVDADRLELLPPLGPRLLQLGPEPAAAWDPGARSLFVFSAGVDLEAVPVATDYRRRHRADRTVLVIPERDALPAIRAMSDCAGIEIRAMAVPF